MKPLPINKKEMMLYISAGFYLPLLSAKKHLEYNLKCNIPLSIKKQYCLWLAEVYEKLPGAKERYYNYENGGVCEEAQQ